MLRAGKSTVAKRAVMRGAKIQKLPANAIIHHARSSSRQSGCVQGSGDNHFPDRKADIFGIATLVWAADWKGTDFGPPFSGGNENEGG